MEEWLWIEPRSVTLPLAGSSATFRGAMSQLLSQLLEQLYI